MAYKVKKFSQIREYEDWVAENGHKIAHADTVVYGCHFVITYKVDEEEALKSAPERVAIGSSLMPTSPVPPQEAVKIIAAPAARNTIQARAAVVKG